MVHLGADGSDIVARRAAAAARADPSRGLEGGHAGPAAGQGHARHPGIAAGRLRPRMPPPGAAAAACAAARRRALRSLVDTQLQAVNTGDVAALAVLGGSSASWRVPSLDGSYDSSGGGGGGGGSTLLESLAAWGGLLGKARVLPTQVLIDEAQSAAAVEWVLRYQLAADSDPPRDDGSPIVRQLLGGTTFQLADGTGDIARWRSYSDGARAHQPVERLGFGDLDPAQIAVGETVLLLHPPLPLLVVSIGMERGVSAK